MLESAIVESLRSLILAYGGRDQDSFRKNAETIIRELNVKNRAGEAKSLRDALAHAVSQRPFSGVDETMLTLNKQTQGLISRISRPLSEALFFPPETSDALNRILREYRGAGTLAEAGLHASTRLLFWGPPGCGKTAAAQWLAAQLSVQCSVVRLGSLITSFVGETGSNLQRVLVAAEQTPMVLLLDEADAIAKARDDENDVGELRRVVNSLLQGLDSIARKRSLIVLASNHSHLFDPAIWRRFDEIIEFKLPGQPERVAQLKYLTSGLQIHGDVKTAARQLDGFSFAEIERAVMNCAKEKVLFDKRSVSFSQIVKDGKKWRLRMRKAAGFNKSH